MFDDFFSLVFDGCWRRKRLITALAAIVTAAAALGLGSITLENDLELMLPGDQQVRRSMRFLREARFSDDVVLSLNLDSPDRSPADLIQAARELEGRLGPPLVTGVVSGVSGSDMVDGALSLLERIPELTDERTLSRIDSELNPEGVRRSLRRSYRQLVTPASTFVTPFVRADPLGISSGILRSLQEISSSLGYEVEIEEGHFISRDREHALLIVNTPVTVTDASRARDLIRYLRSRLAELPEYVSADIVAGHLHTISNEDVMKRDIWLALGIAAAAFFFLFVFLFRDVRAAVLFLLPVAAVLVAINLSNLVLSHLSYFIVGMGGVIAGISVDYGIHVYMAVRSAGGRPDAVKLVAKPVVTGALTTVAVFAAFFFSSVQGYHQLALFSILSIGLCLVSALFLLPHLMTGAGRVEAEGPSRSDGPDRFQRRGGLIIAGWALAMLAAAVSMTRLRFDHDIRQFDGSEPYVIDAEQRFHRVWGGREQPAIFVVPGRGMEAALRRNSDVYEDVTAAIGRENFASLAAVWPLEEERLANRARWSEFWRQGREAKLKQLLREYGAEYGFSEDAFSPFFANLDAERGSEAGLEDLGDLEVFARLKQRFVQERPECCQVLSFFPDEEALVSKLSAVSERHPGTFLVSRRALSRALSRSVSSEIVYLSGVAVILVPLLAGVLLRSIRLTALALVPVVTGVSAILGMIPLLGFSLNAPSVISAMVAVGLCIDYGIFMVYHCHHHVRTGTEKAVTLSAVTTLIGAGVLLFARHPVLFAIGVTMVTGVLAGYASAMLVLPCLYRRLVPEDTRPA